MKGFTGIKSSKVFSIKKKINRVQESFSFLDRREKLILLAYGIFQATTGLLDVIGIGMIGLVGMIAIKGVTGKEYSTGTVESVIEYLKLGNLDFQYQVVIFAVAACLTLVLRSLIAFYVSRKILDHLSSASARISSKILDSLMQRDIAELDKYSKQELVYLLTTTTSKVTLEVTGSITFIFADLLSITFTVITLFFIDFQASIFTLFLVVFVGSFIFSKMKNEAYNLGKKIREESIATNTSIVSILENFRFIVSSNLMSFAKNQFKVLRVNQSRIQSRLSFMPYISKYLFEIVIIIVALTISALQFIRFDATEAITSLTIFLAAGGRLAPIALRIQQSLLQLKSSQPLLDIVKSNLENIDSDQNDEFVLNSPSKFIPKISVNKVSYRFPNSNSFFMQNLELEIVPGTLCALIGPSGSGKSSLIDLILGFNLPTKGEIKIGDLSSRLALQAWSGEVGYVPQRANILPASVGENIRFGRSGISDWDIENSLKLVGLQKKIMEMNLGLRTEIGEGSLNLSLGQLQRIMIARAIVTRPKLLIMDEPTSALDPESEMIVSELFSGAGKEFTTLVATHRIHTVRNANLVVYLEDGRIKAQGSFENIRKQIPNFKSYLNQSLDIKKV